MFHSMWLLMLQKSYATSQGDGFFREFAAKAVTKEFETIDRAGSL